MNSKKTKIAPRGKTLEWTCQDCGCVHTITSYELGEGIDQCLNCGEITPHVLVDM